jgi:biopolymer transport protein ExbB
MDVLTILQVVTTETTEMASTGTREETFLSLAMKGGWVMIPIIILSIVAVYIFFERYFAIKKAQHVDMNFMNRIRDYIMDGKIDAANSLCLSTYNPVARMIENVGRLEVYKLEKGLPTLATVSGGAPMIGFLGTVIGMVQAFMEMSTSGNNINVSQLSTGIYTALITTVAGLIVGIIAYFAYNILVAKVEKVVNNLEASTTEFMDLLNEPVK